MTVPFFVFVLNFYIFADFIMLLRFSNIILIQLRLLLCTTLFARVPTDSLTVDRVEFVKNCGQWQNPSLFSAQMRGAAVFAEQNALLFAMIGPEDLNRFHEAKHERAATQVHSVMSFRAAAYRMSFVGANPRTKVEGENPYSFHHNYFLGKNPDTWSSNVPVYASLHYHELYQGVDLLLYQTEEHLKYEFVVAPNTDPSAIRVQYDGLKSLSLAGDMLMLQTFVSRIYEAAPIAYQIRPSGDTLKVPCRYSLNGKEVSFVLGKYDPALPLIIDPTLIFSHYSGSTADNWGYTATYDYAGCLYGGGIAFGIGYPTTVGAYQMNYYAGNGTGLTDVAITKFDATGDTIRYATYLGGSNTDIPHSLYVNDLGELYVLGTTGSSDFPVNAYDTVFHGGPSVTLSTTLKFSNGSDMFISKFSADGSQLLASTFMGGSMNDGLNTAPVLRKNYADDNRGEIVMDANSNVYVVSSTYSADFPVSEMAFDTTYSGGQDVCLFMMNQDLSQLIWSSFFGGAGNEAGYSLALGSDNSVYCCGGTTSSELSTNPGAFQQAYAGNADGFIIHVSANGNQLMQCSYLGKTGYDQAYLVKVDRNDCPYLFGQTDASGYSWIYNAQYHKPNGGQFLTKMSPSLDTIVWSTAFGSGRGGPDISPTALMVDFCNGVYMSGWGDASHSINNFGGTTGMDFTVDAYQNNTDGSDFYLICISDDASRLVYATFFGGISSGGIYNNAHEHVDGGTSRFDRKGCIYQAVCAGCGGNSLFPVYPPNSDTYYNYHNTNHSGNCNLGVIKMDFNLPAVVADFMMPGTLCAPDTLVLMNTSQSISSQTYYYWDFGDGTTSTAKNPQHYYTQSGYYTVTLIVQDTGSCNFADTLAKNLLVLSNTSTVLPTLPLCKGDFIQIGLPPSSNVTYAWLPDSTLSHLTISNPIARPTVTTDYTLYASSGVCADTLRQRVEVSSLTVTPCADTLICFGDTAILSIVTDNVPQQVEWSSVYDFSNVFATGTMQLKVSPAATTTYYVRVTYNACVVVKAIVVTVKKVDMVAEDYSVCFEPGVQLSVTHNAGDPCQYAWTLGDGSVYTGATPYVTPSAATMYYVTVTSAEGCMAADSGRIRMRSGTFESPFDAWCDRCTIMTEASTILYVTDYGPDYQYQWTPEEDLGSPDQPVTTAHPHTTTLFTVIVTDTFNCSKTDTVTITVIPLICDHPYVFIPNAFSPNQDELNDVLYVQSEILKDFYFAIYSRWGQKVFETTRAEVGWDGTFNGKPCQNGVYDYYFKGTCVDGQEKEITGNIMLVR